MKNKDVLKKKKGVLQEMHKKIPGNSFMPYPFPSSIGTSDTYFQFILFRNNQNYSQTVTPRIQQKKKNF